MTTLLGNIALNRRPHDGGGRDCGRLLSTRATAVAFHALSSWRERAGQRRALPALSDAVPKDLGIRRWDAFGHSRAAAALLGGLLPALAGLAPLPAQANDRDLRGTPVPAAACVEVFRSTALTEDPWALGFFAVSGTGRNLSLRCPLPVNNVDLSGTTDDNDLSKLRVHYRDTDGFGALTAVVVRLTKTATNASGNAESTFVCQWNSNADGTGVATATKATKACVHDVAAEAFYHLAVFLQSGAGHTAQFLGVTFPP